jgi:hypothetical protein
VKLKLYKICTYMNPIYCLPLEFLLNVPAPRDHVHCMDEPMDPLGMRDILGFPTSFTVVNMLLGIFSTLIPIGQFKVRNGMEYDLYEFNHLHLVLYICAGVSPTNMQVFLILQHPWPEPFDLMEWFSPSVLRMYLPAPSHQTLGHHIIQSQSITTFIIYAHLLVETSYNLFFHLSMASSESVS